MKNILNQFPLVLANSCVQKMFHLRNDINTQVSFNTYILVLLNNKLEKQRINDLCWRGNENFQILSLFIPHTDKKVLIAEKKT